MRALTAQEKAERDHEIAVRKRNKAAKAAEKAIAEHKADYAIVVTAKLESEKHRIELEHQLRKSRWEDRLRELEHDLNKIMREKLHSPSGDDEDNTAVS